jgi:ubiquinone/menaquinone biosynthesis C-methylase UbiE
VGFYSRIIFPRLCDFALDRPLVAELRQKLLASAQGRILEIGFGTGLNLPHYPPRVQRLMVIEPNDGMTRRAQRRIKATSIQLDRRKLSGERLPLADRTFDCIVCTFTLCSIDDVRQALGEIHRLLSTGGRFLFLEHGLAPEASVQKWQRRLNRLQMLAGDGCHLDRNITNLVAAQPFSSIESEQFYLAQTPKTHGFISLGTATK